MLTGKILNIQTSELRFRERIMPGFEKFDENYFTWVREKGDSPEYFYLTYMRVFHETTPSGPSSRALPQIGTSSSTSWEIMYCECSISSHAYR